MYLRMGLSIVYLSTLILSTQFPATNNMAPEYMPRHKLLGNRWKICALTCKILLECIAILSRKYFSGSMGNIGVKFWLLNFCQIQHLTLVYRMLKCRCRLFIFTFLGKLKFSYVLFISRLDLTGKNNIPRSAKNQFSLC